MPGESECEPADPHMGSLACAAREIELPVSELRRRFLLQ